MIIDSVKAFEKYINLHKDFEKVYKFIKANDLSTLELGNHPIVPNDVWCNIVEMNLNPADKENEPYIMEVHDSFIDIHVVVSGTDVIGFKSRLDCQVEGWKYDEKKDIATIEEAPDVFLSLPKGNLAILFPADAHSPLMGEGELRKAIFKVRL